jgi:flagellin-like hook-associated protein FlgL
MRITSQMMIDNTIFNLSRNINRLMRVESMLSTGRRIINPSDDPIGTQYALRYRNRLAEIEQYISNIQVGVGRLSTYEEGLDDLNNYFSDANQLAIEMANDSNDANARNAAANVVDSIIQKVLEIGNTHESGRYIYSGHKTKTVALEGHANGITFKGDRGVINLEINMATRIKSNLTGNEVFLKQLSILGQDADLKVAITDDTLIGDLNLGSGVETVPGTFRVIDNNGINPPIDLNMNVPPNATVGEVIADINNQLATNGNVLSLRIADDGKSFEWVTSITSNTLLSNLNDGAGIDLSAPGTFRIRNDDSSILIDVDISAATTVGDVINSIQGALEADPAIPAGSVKVRINTDGTALEIVDDNEPALGLLIEDTAGTKAADLGINGSIAPVLAGTDLISAPDFEASDIGSQLTGSNLGILGNIVQNTTGSSVKAQVSSQTTLASLNNGLGYNLGIIRVTQGDNTVEIDLTNISDLDLDGSITINDLLATINNTPGLNIEASINAAGTGIQIQPTIIDPGTGAEYVSDVVDRSLIIENYSDSDDTARALGLEGSSDMVGSLMLLETALRENDKDLIGRLIGNMNLAMQHLLASRADVGARMSNLETTNNRLEDMDVHITRLLSEVEDADIITLVSDLAREENLYQAALLASSKSIQPSLVDFLM